MAHIPQDARYVDPPTEREVDEDAVTEAAVEELIFEGQCPACKHGWLLDDYVFAGWVRRHATECAPLRERVLDRMAREGE